MSRATKTLQRNILARAEAAKPPPPKIRSVPKGTKVNRNCDKTPLMILIEAEENDSIENLIWKDSIRNVASKLHVAEPTVTRWRKQFPIAYQRGKNNRKLPVSKSNGNGGA